MKECRERSGMSQESLGKALGVTRQTIISIEKNRYVPSLELAIKIARHFGSKVTDIFDIEGV